MNLIIKSDGWYWAFKQNYNFYPLCVQCLLHLWLLTPFLSCSLFRYVLYILTIFYIHFVPIFFIPSPGHFVCCVSWCLIVNTWGISLQTERISVTVHFVNCWLLPYKWATFSFGVLQTDSSINYPQHGINTLRYLWRIDKKLTLIFFSRVSDYSMQLKRIFFAAQMPNFIFNFLKWTVSRNLVINTG